MCLPITSFSPPHDTQNLTHTSTRVTETETESVSWTWKHHSFLKVFRERDGKQHWSNALAIEAQNWNSEEPANFLPRADICICKTLQNNPKPIPRQVCRSKQGSGLSFGIWSTEINYHWSVWFGWGLFALIHYRTSIPYILQIIFSRIMNTGSQNRNIVAGISLQDSCADSLFPIQCCPGFF